jgi:hypothetical protein
MQLKKVQKHLDFVLDYTDDTDLHGSKVANFNSGFRIPDSGNYHL